MPTAEFTRLDTVLGLPFLDYMFLCRAVCFCGANWAQHLSLWHVCATTELTEVAHMLALTWSSWHICFAVPCAVLLQPLACGLNLRSSLDENQPVHRLIVKLFSHYYTSAWWRLVIGLTSDPIFMWPLTVFRCAIWFLAKHSTLVILCGSCLWTSVHEDTGHCILKQNWYRHCLCRCCSYTSKLIIKPDDEPGFCCLLIPYCQWQYSTVYAMGVSTEPSRWEWLSIALFCSYRSRRSDVPRKIFKR